MSPFWIKRQPQPDSRTPPLCTTPPYAIAMASNSLGPPPQTDASTSSTCTFATLACVRRRRFDLDDSGSRRPTPGAQGSRPFAACVVKVLELNIFLRTL